jgi:hypothetical protein
MEYWRKRVIIAAMAAIGLAVPGAKLAGQEVWTTLYVGAGNPSSDSFSAAVGLRVDVSRTWGAYGRMARRVGREDCTASLPPYCRYPEGDAREYALGVSRMANAGAWRIMAAAGGGAISWQRESDPFIDLAADARRPLGSRASFLLGAHAIMAPGVERQRRGYDPVVQKKNVLLPTALVGLSLHVW